MSLEPLELTLGPSDSAWLGSGAINAAVSNILWSVPRVTQSIVDTYLPAIEDCKDNIPSHTKDRQNPGHLPNKIWNSCVKEAQRVNALLDKERVAFIQKFVETRNPLPAAVLVTGGASGSQTLQNELENMVKQQFIGMDIIFASDSPISQFGGERYSQNK